MNGKKFIYRSYGCDGIVKYNYEDKSTIIFDLSNKVVHLADCNNEIIFTERLTKKYKYNLDLLKNAIDFFRYYYPKRWKIYNF